MSEKKLPEKYFKDLNNTQKNQFFELIKLYEFWNRRINVVSRKDLSHLSERHILPSLSIGRIIKFRPETTVLDVGTGGGFPGIPLAILFPETEFTLLDSILKKLKVVEDIVYNLKLKNVKTIRIRAENYTKKFDFIVSRAVKPLPEFVELINDNIKPKNINKIPNGIFYLTGGEIEDQIKYFKNYIKVHHLKYIFKESFFETKKLIYINLENISD